MYVYVGTLELIISLKDVLIEVTGKIYEMCCPFHVVLKYIGYHFYHWLVEIKIM